MELPGLEVRRAGRPITNPLPRDEQNRRARKISADRKKNKGLKRIGGWVSLEAIELLAEIRRETGWTTDEALETAIRMAHKARSHKLLDDANANRVAREEDQK